MNHKNLLKRLRRNSCNHKIKRRSMLRKITKSQKAPNRSPSPFKLWLNQFNPNHQISKKSPMLPHRLSFNNLWSNLTQLSWIIKDWLSALMLRRPSTNLLKVSHHLATLTRTGSTTTLLAKTQPMQLRNRYLRCGKSSWLTIKISYLSKLTSSQPGISTCKWVWRRPITCKIS